MVLRSPGVPCAAGLGVVETPVPRLISIPQWIANGIGESVAECGRTFLKPRIRGRLVKCLYKWFAIRSCKVDGAPCVVFAEAWWRANRENVFDRSSGIEL